MINPFTLKSKIETIQNHVMDPLYGEYSLNTDHTHKQLLHFTGIAISLHTDYIEELSKSSFVKLIFNVLNIIGGVKRLGVYDFERFVNYVNNGGINALLNMLSSDDMEKSFLNELDRLPRHIRDNAHIILLKSKELHSDYVTSYFESKYGSDPVPSKLMKNFVLTDQFILRLSELAKNKRNAV